MGLKTKTPTAGTVGAGNVIIFPGRKVTSSKIIPQPPSSKAHLRAALDSETAFRRLIIAAEHFAYEPGEQTCQDFEEAKDRVLSLINDGGDHAA